MIVWQHGRAGVGVVRVFLSSDRASADARLRTAFPLAIQQTCPEIGKLGKDFQRLLNGEPVRIGLAIAALHQCSDFQRRVLIAEHSIPRGRVSAYGTIAARIGKPGAARAVGNALARNPFPLIVPCHRAIRSDGELGGFQGGTRMKRALLELEGVRFSPDGKVLGPYAWC